MLQQRMEHVIEENCISYGVSCQCDGCRRRHHCFQLLQATESEELKRVRGWLNLQQDFWRESRWIFTVLPFKFTQHHHLAAPSKLCCVVGHHQYSSCWLERASAYWNQRERERVLCIKRLSLFGKEGRLIHKQPQKDFGFSSISKHDLNTILLL